jgi:hypothetical protein
MVILYFYIPLLHTITTGMPEEVWSLTSGMPVLPSYVSEAIPITMNMTVAVLL